MTGCCAIGKRAGRSRSGNGCGLAIHPGGCLSWAAHDQGHVVPGVGLEILIDQKTPSVLRSQSVPISKTQLQRTAIHLAVIALMGSCVEIRVEELGVSILEAADPEPQREGHGKSGRSNARGGRKIDALVRAIKEHGRIGDSTGVGNVCGIVHLCCVVSIHAGILRISIKGIMHQLPIAQLSLCGSGKKHEACKREKTEQLH